MTNSELFQIVIVFLLTAREDCLLSTLQVQLCFTKRSNFPFYSKFDDLVFSLSNCVATSYERYLIEGIGRDREGSWIENSLLNEAVSILDSSIVTTDHPSIQFIRDSPFPAYSCLFSCSGFDIMLLHSTKFMPMCSRRHNPGTIILFQKVYGDCYIQSSIKGRQITYDKLDQKSILRMGGSSKVFGTGNDEKAAILEISVHPPRRNQEGFAEIGGFESDITLGNGTIMKFEFPPDQLPFIFGSIEDVVKQNAREDASSALEKSLKNVVGGLGTELDGLIRRVLSSRKLDSTVLESLGVSHVRGVLLYGPPGCGKTLIARQLARALNAREPKIVNGPEVLDKFVGEAERNIRNLFAEAEKEWALRGPESELHVVIFDELDSIAKTRGSLRGDGSGVRDSVVNQLLALLDGVQSMDNILVVGLTNRKELIDPALLRPGRLEVHVEIKLPDRAAREEILSIILKPMAREKLLFPPQDVDQWVEDLAGRTSGWSGADLTGLVRSAVSFAINRQQAFADAVRARGGVVGLGDSLQRRGSVVILWKDFEGAFKDVSKPRHARLFGIKERLKAGLDGFLREGDEVDSFNDELEWLSDS